MDFRPVERAADAFQQPVTPAQITAMCRRAFGPDVEVRAAVELGGGMYNTTYRVDLDHGRSVVLRVAPAPDRQYRIERELMRNEHASTPYLAPIASMLPRLLAADFTHQLVGRDHLFQSLLDGIPARDVVGTYSGAQWRTLFRQLGVITRTIHSVRGDHPGPARNARAGNVRTSPQRSARFGPVNGPRHTTWSEAILTFFDDLTADLHDAGLDISDIRQISAMARSDRAVLDEITAPRLLHGDLWTGNIMLAPDTPTPTITGVLDHDRAWWGDPAADWTIHLAASRPGTERDAFWETYRPPPATPNMDRRALYYRARHLGAIRLERHHLGRNTAPPANDTQLRDVLDQLRT